MLFRICIDLLLKNFPIAAAEQAQWGASHAELALYVVQYLLLREGSAGENRTRVQAG